MHAEDPPAIPSGLNFRFSFSTIGSMKAHVWNQFHGCKDLLFQERALIGTIGWLSVLLLIASGSAVEAKDRLRGIVNTQPQEQVANDAYACTTNNGSITITRYAGSGGAVIIPGRMNGLPVTCVGDSAFYSCINVASVTIPTNVTTIGDMAFRSCTGLSSVTIPASVTRIGDSAFACCINLAAVTIPAKVTYIGDNAFSYCSSLTGVTIPRGVTCVRYGTFQYCSRLVKVKIPDSVTHIEDMAFAYCPHLASITIPDSVIRIGDLAFCSCTQLANVTIGRGVASIRGGVFRDCTSLKDVYFRGDAPSVMQAAFDGATNSIVYHVPGTSGWGSTFGGRPAAVWRLQAP